MLSNYSRPIHIFKLNIFLFKTLIYPLPFVVYLLSFGGLLINIVQSFLGFIDFRFCFVAIESFFCFFW